MTQVTCQYYLNLHFLKKKTEPYTMMLNKSLPAL